MFAGGKGKSSTNSAIAQQDDDFTRNQTTLDRRRGSGLRQSNQETAAFDERQQFLIVSKSNNNNDNNNRSSSSTNPLVPIQARESNKRQQQKANNNRKAKLAREETVEDDLGPPTCPRMLLNFVKRKRIFIPLVIISCMAAIYCIPYIEIEPKTTKRLPHIPFNFRDGPLRPASASSFKVEHLFREQIHGPESIALDSTGNMYMAIEGGFILYAHLNKSSPLKRSYYGENLNRLSSLSQTEGGSIFANNQQFQPNLLVGDQLVKIAELNAIKQVPYEQKRKARENNNNNNNNVNVADGLWRRECQLDEKVYGSSLHSGGVISTVPQSNEIDSPMGDEQRAMKRFISNVCLSRCSKPLGLRLSQDESYLYVIDTLSGLYRVSLKVSEKPHSTQRLVTKLVDFKKSQLLPVVSFDSPAGSQQPQQQLDTSIVASPNGLVTTAAQIMTTADGSTLAVARARAQLNISMVAVDDLVVDYGAGTRNGDVIYLTVASQIWPALSFLYDMLEGRPSGVVLRYDTGSNQLSVLNPTQVAHVRTSALELANSSSRLYTTYNATGNRDEPYLGIGAPRLDENDVFDDRPLHFPNGLELTDDKQALLIADTTNKRIIKHYIRGARRGTSDLWAWTPMFPDNIRRGFDKRDETFWVVGCGQDTTNKFDPLDWLNGWPMLRKYILKNIYLFGWLIESFGTHVLKSVKVRDFGYSFKIGNSLLERMCPGMMVLQYNKYGDIIRSIYSKEFPNDLAYYSQVNELIDAKNQEHILYLSSPYYNYVTKLTLPTDSFDVPSSSAPILNEVR